MKNPGFILVASTVLANILTRGFYYGLSRLFVAFLDTFKTTRTETSLLQSTFTAVYAGSGMLSGLFVQRVGARRSGLLGAGISGVSISCCYLAPSFGYMVALLGVMLAAGQMIIHLSCLSLINQCVEGKLKYVLLSVVGVGPGVGGMMYTYLLEYLLETYGLRGLFLIVGGIAFNVIPLVLLWPSQSNLMKFNATVATSKSQNATNGGTTQGSVGTQRSIAQTITYIARSKAFVLSSLGCIVILSPQLNAIIFVSDLIRDRNIDIYMASLSIFMYSLFSILGRLAPGFLKLVPRISVLSIYVFASIIGTLGFVVVVYVQTPLLLVTACGMSGLSVGLTLGSQPIAAVKLVGREYMSAGIGFSMTLSGLYSLGLGPLAGYIRDVTGAYEVVFLCNASMVALGGVINVAAMCARKNNSVVS